MLRIFTTLRNAFERPPEREGRELRFATNSEDKGGGMTMGEESGEEPATDREGGGTLPPIHKGAHKEVQDIIGSGEEPREEPPEGEIHGGEEAPEPEAPRIRIKAETLVEKAKSALETIAKIKAILGNKEFMNKVREAAKRDTKIQDLLTSFEEDAQVCNDAEKTIKDLKSEAEQFVLWQHPTERKLPPNKLAAANVRARCIVCKPESPEETDAERQIQQKVHNYLSESATADQDERWNTLNIDEKTPTIERLEELARIDETLKKMDETLTGYDTGLKVYLAQIQKLKDDIESGREIAPPQQEWGGGSFTLKLIHFVYLAMAVKKIYDTWKKQWEYDFERAVGDCAAAISPWVAPNTVTQRLLQEQETKIREVKESKKKDYEKYSFRELHHAILTPYPDPAEKMAQLEVAAEKGWLYGIEEETASLTVFGQPLHACVPRTWSKNPSMIAEYHRKLNGMYLSGKRTQAEQGATEAKGYLEDGYGIAQMESAIEEGMYWKAVGIAEWVMKSRVGSGQGGAAITATILRLLAENPLFGKLVPAEMIKNIGGMAEAGIPQYSLYTLKKFRESLKNTGRRTISSTQKWGKIADMGDIPRAFAELQHRFTSPSGKALVTAKEVYSANELAQFATTGTVPSDAQIISEAVGKVLAGHPVHTTDGQWVSIYDSRETTLQKYRKEVEKSQYQLDTRTTLDKFDMGHFIWMNEGKMLSPNTIAALFDYNAPSDEIIANRGGGRLTAFLEGIAASYNKWESRVVNEGAPRDPLDKFTEDIAKRLAPGVTKLKHQGGQNHLPLIMQDIERNTVIPDWLRRVLQ